MSAVTVEMFVQAINTLWFAFFLGAVIAVWVGGFLARLSWNGVWLFLRRSRRFRRFDRAMVRREERARRKHFAVVLMLRRPQAEELVYELKCPDSGVLTRATADEVLRQCARWGVS